MPTYNPTYAPNTVFGDEIQPNQVYAADGDITAKNGFVHITKGSAAALTLAAPVSGTDDGKCICIVSETAFAHVVTSPVRGFNAKGSSGTATFGAAKGNNIWLVARGGDWWNAGNTNVTIA